MKTVNFQSQQFPVPSWANYITQDADGYYVWEDMPVFDEELQTYYDARRLGRYIAAFPVKNNLHEIMKIED